MSKSVGKCSATLRGKMVTEIYFFPSQTESDSELLFAEVLRNEVPRCSAVSPPCEILPHYLVPGKREGQGPATHMGLGFCVPFSALRPLLNPILCNVWMLTPRWASRSNGQGCPHHGPRAQPHSPSLFQEMLVQRPLCPSSESLTATLFLELLGRAASTGQGCPF